MLIGLSGSYKYKDRCVAPARARWSAVHAAGTNTRYERQVLVKRAVRTKQSSRQEL